MHKTFEINCKDFLNSKNIKGDDAQDLLDIVFGDQGIIDSENKADLNKKLESAKDIMLQFERKILGCQVKKSFFHEYLQTREKSALAKMISNKRKKCNICLRLIKAF